MSYNKSYGEEKYEKPPEVQIKKELTPMQYNIVTNRKRDMALMTLNSLGIAKFFKDIIGGDDASCLKPFACSLDKALKYNKNGKRSMIVGDMDLDISSGKRAGILTCAVTYGIGKKRTY